MADMRYNADTYRHYTKDGTPIILTSNVMRCTGYDEDGDKVQMNIYIDEDGQISGNYSAGLFTRYTLSGIQSEDGVLEIDAESNIFTSDTKFRLSAKSKGELTGLRYGVVEHYPLNLIW